MNGHERPPRPLWLPEVDLRPHTRNSDRAITTFYVVHSGERFPWIRCGLLSRVSVETKRQWVGAYYDHGITDREEKSAYAFHFDVTGVQLEDFHQGMLTLKAWIAGSGQDCDSLKVPSQPPDLSKLEWCPVCKGNEKHKMTTFTPPTNLDLWRHLRGHQILIETYPFIPEHEQ